MKEEWAGELGKEDKEEREEEGGKDEGIDDNLNNILTGKCATNVVVFYVHELCLEIKVRLHNVISIKSDLATSGTVG